jgi:hypothetical protein
MNRGQPAAGASNSASAGEFWLRHTEVRILSAQPPSPAISAISGLRKKAPYFRGFAEATCTRRLKTRHFRPIRRANRALVSGRHFGISGICQWPTGNARSPLAGSFFDCRKWHSNSRRGESRTLPAYRLRTRRSDGSSSAAANTAKPVRPPFRIIIIGSHAASFHTIGYLVVLRRSTARYGQHFFSCHLDNEGSDAGRKEVRPTPLVAISTANWLLFSGHTCV